MFDAVRNTMPQKLVLFHLALKIIRMIFSVFILVLYCLAVRGPYKGVHGYFHYFLFGESGI
jgi:hypothetical protein